MQFPRKPGGTGGFHVVTGGVLVAMVSLWWMAIATDVVRGDDESRVWENDIEWQKNTQHEVPRRVLFVNMHLMLSPVNQILPQLLELRRRGYEVRGALMPPLCGILERHDFECIRLEYDAEQAAKQMGAQVNELLRFDITSSFKRKPVLSYSAAIAAAHAGFHSYAYAQQLQVLRNVATSASTVDADGGGDGIGASEKGRQRWKPDVVIGYGFGAFSLDFAREVGAEFVALFTFAPSMLRVRNHANPCAHLAYSITEHQASLQVRLSKLVGAVVHAVVNARYLSKLNSIRAQHGVSPTRSLYDYDSVLQVHIGIPFLLEPPGWTSPLQLQTGSALSFPPITSLTSLNSFHGADRKLVELLNAQYTAKRNVVYVAFGSLAHVPEDQIRTIIRGVLDAAENTFVLVSLRDVPNNARAKTELLNPGYGDSEFRERFHVTGWLNQSIALAHESVRVFVTHCGSSSIAESVLTGKPMLALPFFGDQPANAKRVVEAGVAIELNRYEMDAAAVAEAVAELLSDTDGMFNKSLARLIRRNKGAGALGTEGQSPARRFADAIDDLVANGVDHRIPLSLQRKPYSSWWIALICIAVSLAAVIARRLAKILWYLLAGFIAFFSSSNNANTSKRKTT